MKAKRILAVILCACMAAGLSVSFFTSFLTVSAEDLNQEIELLFFTETEKNLNPSDFTEDVLLDENYVLNFTVVGFEIKEADWVVSERYLFDFAIQTLRVDVIDESHVSFTFQLMPGIDYPTEISIWCSAEGGEVPETPNIIPEGYEREDDSIDFTWETVYKINLKLPGLTHKAVFDKNCEDEVSNLPEMISVKYNDSYLAEEPEQIPVREGYVFAGWSDYPDFFHEVFHNGTGTIQSDTTMLYAFWDEDQDQIPGQDGDWDGDRDRNRDWARYWHYSRMKEKQAASASVSSSHSETKAEPALANTPVTCQMAGFPQGYVWNEAAKACQYGYLDQTGKFHSERAAVPNTADGY